MRFAIRKRFLAADVERQFAWARWVLPLFLFVMVFFYEARELGMRERAAPLGGTLAIEPRRPHGTRVTLRVPLAAPASNLAARVLPTAHPVDAILAHRT